MRQSRKLNFAIFAAVAFFASPASTIDLNPLPAIKSAVEHAVEDRSSADGAKGVEIKAAIVMIARS